MKLGVLIGSLIVIALLIFIPNPINLKIQQEAKVRGYLAFTPEEATELAYEKCSGCHTIDKVTKYCSRCGPPFVVTVHFMKKYIELANLHGEATPSLSDAEIAAIVQVWNGLVGNWEADWPTKDLRKLLDGDQALTKLLDTPVEKRLIEMALMSKSAPGSYKEYEKLQ